jgi:hypothetical protein
MAETKSPALAEQESPVSLNKSGESRMYKNELENTSAKNPVPACGRAVSYVTDIKQRIWMSVSISDNRLWKQSTRS